jgi:hypothetical protein
MNEHSYGGQQSLLTDVKYVFVNKGKRGEEEQVAGEDRVKRNCIIIILH